MQPKQKKSSTLHMNQKKEHRLEKRLDSSISMTLYQLDYE